MTIATFKNLKYYLIEVKFEKIFYIINYLNGYLYNNLKMLNFVKKA